MLNSILQYNYKIIKNFKKNQSHYVYHMMQNFIIIYKYRLTKANIQVKKKKANMNVT